MADKFECSSSSENIAATLENGLNQEVDTDAPCPPAETDSGGRLIIAMSKGQALKNLLVAYIACSWGVSHVGFVTICYGASGALTALCVGQFVKCFSQTAALLLATAVSGAFFATLFLWQPSPDQHVVFFAIAGAWGMCDAIWWSQVTALYGLMFPNDREAAFSSFCFWAAFGFLLCYSYANYFSVAVKISILIFIMLSGVTGFLLCQLKIRRSAGKEYVDLKHDE